MNKLLKKRGVIFLVFGIILLVHSLILTKLIYFPYPELFIYPYLTNHGLKPYSQILDQHFPGLMFLPINFDNLGMNTPEVARIWSIGIVFIIHIMIFLICSKIFKSETRALLVNILYLAWQPFFEGWVLWVDSFLPLILLLAFYALYKKNFFWCGLFLGLGIVFKQTLIPLSAFILIYAIWNLQDVRAILRYILGLCLPVIIMIYHLWSIGVLKDFWYWTVVFNLTTFAQFGRGDGPTVAHLARVLLVFGCSFFLLRKIKFIEGRILIIFLFGTLLGLSTRFDFVHLQPALPFALFATVYGLEGIKGLRRLGFVCLYSLVLIWWLIIFYRGHLGDRVISFDSTTYSLAAKIKNYTSPEEKIFVFGAQPHLYQMSNTLPAGDIFVFQFPWFMMVAEDRILAGIIRDQPKIIVSDRDTQVEGKRITEFSPKIDQYILKNYQQIDNVGTTAILRRPDS